MKVILNLHLSRQCYLCCVHTINSTKQLLYSCYAAFPVENWRILLEQCFYTYIPFLDWIVVKTLEFSTVLHMPAVKN